MRKNNCTWCGFGLVQDYFNSVDNTEVYLEFYPENGMFFVTVLGLNADGEPVEDHRDIQFKHCPMCGKKVGRE